MARTRKYTDEQEKAIAFEYNNESMTMRMLGNKYGLSVSGIKLLLLRQKVPHGYNDFGKNGCRPYRKKFSVEEADSIATEFLETSVTVNALAVHHKCGNDTISRLLFERNIDTRLKQGSSIHKNWLFNYKSDKVCIRCGFNNPVALQFHHRDPSKKLFTISNRYISKHSIDEVLEEIAKCDILCANCHMIEHHG